MRVVGRRAVQRHVEGKHRVRLILPYDEARHVALHDAGRQRHIGGRCAVPHQLIPEKGTEDRASGEHGSHGRPHSRPSRLRVIQQPQRRPSEKCRLQRYAGMRDMSSARIMEGRKVLRGGMRVEGNGCSPDVQLHQPPDAAPTCGTRCCRVPHRSVP